MKRLIHFVWFITFPCCAMLPQLADDAKEILNDDCMTITIDRDAFQKDTDIKVNIEILNKDVPAKTF